jgi:uncharacterized LabA/DUF88 family protein
VSKNVAVFVDVANIFYAAKAAGVDIDYVTLLKSATAGRDFVRAYAYTGLDPENENQRQFHSFLARSGYKVISKDIRKYGDGRIKANLDIELVVDMMRMAQHIDIAVVVSGDGDFAPAIRAVQQLGVRAEVISFRGNTSSDLIDVADVFTDITQIARVEKGVRSGRRVAAEGDLSMTEVPEKETEGLARRRRSRRGEHEEVAERGVAAERSAPRERIAPVSRAVVEVGLPGNLIVLPGERLSRVGPEPDRAPDLDVVDVVEEADSVAEVSDDGREAAADGPRDADTDADGRRRRRRRGGRGRGRGRQGEAEQPGVVVAGAEPILEDEEFLEEEIAPLPQHSSFGSVWDSQLGVNPPAPIAAAQPGNLDDEDFEDEPEIPEYLLAERRQQQQQRGRSGRPGMRPGASGGRRAGYQAAMDRERYGRSAGSTGGGSGFAGGTLRPDRGRPPLNSGNRGPRPPQQSRPSRPAYQDQPRDIERPAPSSEPWSEVPADVQEMLRAELARRQSGTGFNQSTPAPSRSAPPVAETPAPVRAAPRGRGRSTSASSASATHAQAPAESAVTEAPAASAAPARRGRRPAASAPAEAAPAVSQAPDAAAPRTRRPRAVAAAPAAETPIAETAAPKARRTSAPRATTRSHPASAAASESAASSAEVSSEAPAAPRRRTTRKPASEPATGGEA